MECYSRPTNECYLRSEGAYWLYLEPQALAQFHFHLPFFSGSLVHDPLIGELIAEVSSNGALLKLVQQQTVHY